MLKSAHLPCALTSEEDVMVVYAFKEKILRKKRKEAKNWI
jgi:hypothetical protein